MDCPSRPRTTKRNRQSDARRESQSPTSLSHDRDAVMQFPARQHRHDRFLGQLLEIITGHRPADDDGGFRFLDRQLAQRRNGTLSQGGETGRLSESGRGGHHYVLLAAKPNSPRPNGQGERNRSTSGGIHGAGASSPGGKRPGTVPPHPTLERLG